MDMIDKGADMEQPLREKLVAAAAAGTMVGTLGLALLFGLKASTFIARGNSIVLLDVKPPRPPLPKHAPREEKRTARPAREAPSPPNIRSTPTDIVVPPVIVPLPVPTPVVAAPIAGTGTAPSAGASDRAGPGYGAGGEGNGPGGGGDGEGGNIPPVQIGGRLRFEDMPADLRAVGEARVVSVRYRVNIDGRVSDCTVTRSSGNQTLDAITCARIEKRFRFRPSRDGDGNKVSAIVVQTHEWRVLAPDARPHS